jgi:hypothetical protein
MDWNEIWAKIKILLGEIWVDLWPTLKIMITEQGMTAFTSAKNIVIHIQETMPDASGQEKFEAALTQLTGLLLAQGITLGVGILRVCIEMAYRKMMATGETVEEAKAMSEMIGSHPEPIQTVQP